MSSGSYFTIYRKIKKKVSQETIDNLKNEYFLSNKNQMFRDDANEEELKKDMPLLMESSFKHGSLSDDMPNEYYDKDGNVYARLLDFRFCSSFTSLREKFLLDAYRYSKNSTFVSKNEAKLILQAIDYILSKKYSRDFEKILDNEYVELLGDGYSMFDNRFKKHQNPVRIEKDDDGYTMSFDDYGYDNEIKECDDDMRFSLKKAKSCLEAYLNAEEYSFNDEELVLVYSVF